MRVAGTALVVVASLVILLTGVWTAFAFWFQLPFGAVGRIVTCVVWALLVVAALAAMRFRRYRSGGFALYGAVFAGIMFWWANIEPRLDRNWAPEVARTVTGSVEGDRVTLDNVRDFDWKTPEIFSARWKDKRYDLSTLTNVDVILSSWGVDAIAHTLVSFGFADGEHVVFSVEIRRERGEAFSEIGGFFKEFELAFIAATERDIVKLRTNVRKENVSLYPVAMPSGARRALFLSYVEAANGLAWTPRFYNTLTANCTTVAFDLARLVQPGIPFDWRILLSGYLPDYLADHGALAWPKPYGDLRGRGSIGKLANAAGTDADFSAAIRRTSGATASPRADKAGNP